MHQLILVGASRSFMHQVISLGASRQFMYKIKYFRLVLAQNSCAN